jgi:hypothetical protein
VTVHLLRCGRLRRLGQCIRQRVRLLLDVVLEADDAPLLGLIGGGGRRRGRRAPTMPRG